MAKKTNFLGLEYSDGRYFKVKRQSMCRTLIVYRRIFSGAQSREQKAWNSLGVNLIDCVCWKFFGLWQHPFTALRNDWRYLLLPKTCSASLRTQLHLFSFVLWIQEQIWTQIWKLEDQKLEKCAQGCVEFCFRIFRMKKQGVRRKKPFEYWLRVSGP